MSGDYDTAITWGDGNLGPSFSGSYVLSNTTHPTTQYSDVQIQMPTATVRVTPNLLGAPSMKDLDNPVYKASLTEIENLWRVKYKDRWVKSNELQAEDFFKGAAQRLLTVGRLERHVLADFGGEEVYRLLDDRS